MLKIILFQEALRVEILCLFHCRKKAYILSSNLDSKIKLIIRQLQVVLEVTCVVVMKQKLILIKQSDSVHCFHETPRFSSTKCNNYSLPSLEVLDIKLHFLTPNVKY